MLDYKEIGTIEELFTIIKEKQFWRYSFNLKDNLFYISFDDPTKNYFYRVGKTFPTVVKIKKQWDYEYSLYHINNFELTDEQLDNIKNDIKNPIAIIKNNKSNDYIKYSSILDRIFKIAKDNPQNSVYKLWNIYIAFEFSPENLEWVSILITKNMFSENIIIYKKIFSVRESIRNDDYIKDTLVAILDENNIWQNEKLLYVKI